MPERSRKRPVDLNSLAASIVANAPAAVALGHKGGLKGGRARADKLTAGQRSEIARNAAAHRWGRYS